MSTVKEDELKAQEKKVSGITGQKSLLLWQEQEVLQGYCWVQRGHPEQMKTLIERMKTTVMNLLKQKEKKRLRQANGNAYINLQLSCEELPYDLVSLVVEFWGLPP